MTLAVEFGGVGRQDWFQGPEGERRYAGRVVGTLRAE